MNKEPSWINSTLIHPKLDGGVYVVRFLKEKTNDPYADFGGVCTVDHTRRLVLIYAMHGIFKRNHLRDMIRWAMSLGAEEARAHRAEGHTLPGARRDGDWMIIDLFALKERA